MCSLLLILTLSIQLVASNSKCLASFLVFASLLQLQPYRNHAKEIQESSENRFDGSQKDLYLLKIAKGQHKLVWKYKRGNLVFYFLNNAANMII